MLAPLPSRLNCTLPWHHAHPALTPSPPPLPPPLFQKVDATGAKPTVSAHPARFSPDDKFSRHRVLLKARLGLLLTQSPAPKL